MDKPLSLSVKDYLIRKMAVKLLKSEKMIDAVIDHQFSSANKAVNVHNSLEISGFGKMFFNEKKAQKKVDMMEKEKLVIEGKLDDPNLPEQKRKTMQDKLSTIKSSISNLKPRIYDRFQEGVRGMEKQSDSSNSPEAAD